MQLEKGRILPGKCLIRPIKEEEKQGLIYKPVDVIKAKTYAGEIVMVSEPLANLPVVLSIGDRILHSPHSFVSVTVDNEELRLLNQNEILFIWHE